MTHPVLDSPHYGYQTTGAYSKHVKSICSNLSQIVDTDTTNAHCIHLHSQTMQDPSRPDHVITWRTGGNKDKYPPSSTSRLAAEEVSLNIQQGLGCSSSSSTEQS